MHRFTLLGIFLLCQIAHGITSIWMLIAIATGSPRAWRIAVAYDRVGNAATGGKDSETISSRANRGRSEGRKGWCLLCRLLDRIDKDHCNKSAGV